MKATSFLIRRLTSEPIWNPSKKGTHEERTHELEALKFLFTFSIYNIYSFFQKFSKYYTFERFLPLQGRIPKVNFPFQLGDLKVVCYTILYSNFINKLHTGFNNLVLHFQ